MTVPHRTIALALALLGASGCAPAPADTVPARGEDVAAFQSRVEVTHARQFSVEYRGDIAVLRVSAPLISWSRPGDAEPRTETIVLVPRGREVPPLTGDLTGLPVVRVPAERVATNAEVDDAILTAIGAADRLVAVGGVTTYDDAIRARVERGALGQIGFTWHGPPNLEVLVSRRPDLLLMRLVNLDQADALTRVRAAGVPAVPSFQWAEPTYLGALEWVKLAGLLTGREREATEYFDRIAAQTAAVAAIGAARPTRPSVLWAYYGGGQRWFAYHKGIEESFIHDAGGRSALADLAEPWRDGGTALSTERLTELARDADVWIIGDTHAVTDTGGLDLPPAPVMQLFKPWRERRLWHNYKRRKPAVNAFDWYERHSLRPDLVIADLLTMIHPGAVPDHELHFFDRFVPAGR